MEEIPLWQISYRSRWEDSGYRFRMIDIYLW